jgi:hypothetical protein
MQGAFGEEIKRNFDAFIATSNQIRDRILEAQERSDPPPSGAAQLDLIRETIECAEVVFRQLLMVAYFTANYRSCVTRTTDAKSDHRILDRNTPEGAEFGAKLKEKKRRASEESERPKPFHIGILDEVDTPNPPKRRPKDSDSLVDFKEEIIARYKGLHGLATNRFNLPGLTPMRPATTRILKRNDLLREINVFLDKFRLSPVDKNDKIWREWFLKEFIGLDSSGGAHKPIMVQDTPERKEAVYSETLSRITEIAKMALK